MNGIKNLKAVGLDSNIFIYNLEQSPKYINFTDSIFNRLINKEITAITNIISLSEILSYPNTEESEKQIVEDFFNTPNMDVIDVNQEVAIEAAKIRRKYKFRLPDSIQLATAVVGKAECFVTNDKRLQKFKKLPVILLNSI